MRFLAFCIIAICTSPFIILIEKGMGKVTKDKESKAELAASAKKNSKVLLMFVLIVIIVIIIAALSSCKNNGEETRTGNVRALGAIETIKQDTVQQPKEEPKPVYIPHDDDTDELIQNLDNIVMENKPRYVYGSISYSLEVVEYPETKREYDPITHDEIPQNDIPLKKIINETYLSGIEEYTSWDEDIKAHFLDKLEQAVRNKIYSGTCHIQKREYHLFWSYAAASKRYRHDRYGE